MLLRNYISQRMATYYAQSANAVVGSSPSPIKFRRLWGEGHWKSTLDKLYREYEGHWFTPVELFKPHYSNILANFIVFHAEGHYDYGCNETIDILELGGGRATNAIALLDYLEKTKPEIYARVHYIILDSSPTLHQCQKNRMEQSAHANKVSFLQKDLLQMIDGKHTLLPASKRLTFVIALEVCDNLPHDKIKSINTDSGPKKHSLLQAYVSEAESDDSASPNAIMLEERFATMTDPVLKQIIQLAPNYALKNSVTWVPTVALGMLHALPKYRPNAQVLVADFDWFPRLENVEPNSHGRRSTAGHGEPLIKAMDGNDYDCYLAAPVLSDILFPTDFHTLAEFLQRSWKYMDRTILVQKQANFLLKYGTAEVDQTTSWLTGYSPLIHDYSNMSVLTVTAQT